MNILDVISSIGWMVLETIPYTLALGAVFAGMSMAFPCNPGPSWWRRAEILTDLCWWFIYPLLARFMTLALLLTGAGLISMLVGVPAQTVLEPGFGPLSKLPFWWQVVCYFVLSDLMLYWTHRAFHDRTLWRFHAVHHSPEDLDWISARRFHPVDQLLHTIAPFAILLLLGLSPEVIVFVTPFEICHSALVHANVRWDFGPFRYVVASPVYHRWHHTDPKRGGAKNFAATFPIFDIIFGTFYMPPKVLPDRYGSGDPNFPANFGAQLLYPFKTGKVLSVPRKTVSVPE